MKRVNRRDECFFDDGFKEYRGGCTEDRIQSSDPTLLLSNRSPNACKEHVVLCKRVLRECIKS